MNAATQLVVRLAFVTKPPRLPVIPKAGRLVMKMDGPAARAAERAKARQKPTAATRVEERFRHMRTRLHFLAGDAISRIQGVAE